MTIELDTPIPDVVLPRDGGGTLSLADFRGQWLVLYFYPKDSTPGCTQQAADFRDAVDRLTAAGAQVVGISRDTVKRHDNFKAKNNLNFPLLSDEDGQVCETFGVWVEKKNYGRTYMGIERSTFLIDADGILKKAWRKVRVKEHVSAVLVELESRAA